MLEWVWVLCLEWVWYCVWNEYGYYVGIGMVLILGTGNGFWVWGGILILALESVIEWSTTSSQNLINFCLLIFSSDSQLMSGGKYSRKVSVQRARAGDKLRAHYISLDRVGVDNQEVFSPSYSNPPRNRPCSMEVTSVATFFHHNNY